MFNNEKYNWIEISKEFIQGVKQRDISTGKIEIKFPTHKELCDKYGCAIKTIQIRSMNERWSVQRKMFQKKLKLKSTEIDQADLLGESAKFDSYNLAIIEGVTILLQYKLKPYLDMLNIDSNIRVDNIDDVDYENLPPISTKELREIATIIKDNHATVRSILGESDTSNLLDDVREQLLETRRNREEKKISRAKIKEELKRIEDIEKSRAELEIRREELQKLLKSSQNT